MMDQSGFILAGLKVFAIGCTGCGEDDRLALARIKILKLKRTPGFLDF